ncbi:MAG: tRNA lysidine(34) synthetase TilS [Chloroflexota bacterium]|nr:tRNA lysidine(34) synthetase TilS [Chloroflexota bacterium]
MNNKNWISKIDEIVLGSLRSSGVSENSKIVIGVSGGPDSTALLLSLHRIKNVYPINLHIAHLNHDFRGQEADDDEMFVRKLAESMGIKATTEYQDTASYQKQKRISSFEQGARELRYSFLLAVAQKEKAKFVAVAHTADDLAETVLEHILRGTGLNGLRGMSEISPWPWPIGEAKVKLLRPFLQLTKLQTANYCGSLNQTYRNDSTNEMLSFTRNSVRKVLMPILEENYNPRVQAALIRLARSSYIDFDFINSETDKIWDQLATLETDSLLKTTVTLDKHQFLHVHPSMQRQLVRKAYTIVSQDPRRLTEKHISAVTAMCSSLEPNKIIDLPLGLIAKATYGTLIVGNKPVNQQSITNSHVKDHILTVPTSFNKSISTTFHDWEFTASLIPQDVSLTHTTSNNLSQYFNPEIVTGTCTLRYWKHGDRFQPIGMSGQKKLQDFFSDCKVPQQERNQIPVLTVGKDIAWIVGYRIADWAKVIDNKSQVQALNIISKHTLAN